MDGTKLWYLISFFLLTLMFFSFIFILVCVFCTDLFFLRFTSRTFRTNVLLTNTFFLILCFVLLYNKIFGHGFIVFMLVVVLTTTYWVFNIRVLKLMDQMFLGIDSITRALMKYRFDCKSKFFDFFEGLNWFLLCSLILLILHV